MKSSILASACLPISATAAQRATTGREASYREFQIIEASRWIADGVSVILGSGATFAVGAFAQKNHAPNAQYLIDSGVIDATFATAPTSVCDPGLPSAVRMTSMHDIFFGLLQAGRVDTGVLGAAQIDRYGNINSSYIRTSNGCRRLAGAGGANAIATFVRRLVVVVPHERRRFPAECDYISSPGLRACRPFTHEKRGRELVVVTDRCVMTCSDTAPDLVLHSLMPGTALEEVEERTGFPIAKPSVVRLVEAPTATQINLLREHVDPHGLYITT